MAKIGIYGGSFNPVHFGHIGLVKWVLEHTDLDEIWMLVSPKSPHKTDHADLDTNYAERVEAVRKAIESSNLQTFQSSNGCAKSVVVSDFEAGLPLPSYTANTLRELKKKYPKHEFSLIIGEDNWDVFDKWREWEYILDNYRIFIYPRHTESEEKRNVNCQLSTVHFLSDAPYFDISSTQIRKKMQKDLHN